MWLAIDGSCPRCYKSIKVAEVEPHPSNKKLAIINYLCADCGYVKAKTIPIEPTTFAGK